MAKLLNWNVDWTVGIETLDRDHRRMLDLLAQIACRFGPRAPDPDAIPEGDCPPAHGQGEQEPGALFGALERFADHAREHFRREEEFMRTIDYPGLPAHHKEHALLLAEFSELVRHLRDRGLSRLDGEMLGNFRHWVVADILGADRGFARHYSRMCGNQ